MKRRRAAFAGASLAIAGGAIAAGMLISHGAMAASNDTPSATVSIVRTTDDGTDAYRCDFDASELPTTSLPPVPMGDGVTTGATSVDGPAVIDAVGTSTPSDHPIVVSAIPADGAPAPDGALPQVPKLTVSVSAGPGIVTADGPVSIEVGTGDTVSPITVRDGTDEECAAALTEMSTLPAPQTSPNGEPADGQLVVSGSFPAP